MKRQNRRNIVAATSRKSRTWPHPSRLSADGDDGGGGAVGGAGQGGQVLYEKAK